MDQPTIIADQSDELSRVKSRIRKLAAMNIENGATEAEAKAAMDKIGLLLETFNLELSDAILDAEQCIERKWWGGQQIRPPVDRAAKGIAAFTDCIVYSTHGDDKQGVGLSYFGLESDVQMAIYLTDFINKAIITELEHYKKTDPVYDRAACGYPNRKTLTANFKRGMAASLYRRLLEMNRERTRRKPEEERDPRDPKRAHVQNNRTDIVHILKKKQEKVKDSFDLLGINLTKRYGGRSRYNESARSAGMKAGERVNLNRPLNGKAQGLLH